MQAKSSEWHTDGQGIWYNPSQRSQSTRKRKEQLRYQRNNNILYLSASIKAANMSNGRRGVYSVQHHDATDQTQGIKA